MFSSYFITFLAGMSLSLTFAPLHFLPAIISLSLLLKKIITASSLKEAFKQAYIFGFGFFLTLLYWTAIAVGVYIEKFWWFIPFALFGLPLIMGFFPALAAICTYKLKENRNIHIIFCLSWLFCEWLSSWLLTGFPWGLLGYTFSFSLTMLQSASIFGVYGLSFLAIYTGSMFYSKNGIATRISVMLIVLAALAVFGYNRLENNPTKYSDHTIRIVQPSIPQTDKWVIEEIFNNLDKHIELSTKPFELSDNPPDIIVWSEAALTIPYYHLPVLEKLLMMLQNNQILISGGITSNAPFNEDMEIYTSIIALNSSGELDFKYHKSHLVPFGEYIPFGQYLPLNKITPGIQDYTQGNYEIVSLEKLNLKIKPQICYEAIFPHEAAANASSTDLIINVTNDTWFGNSSGPYQHFEIARMRAIENALPLVRAANNGISAIIDPLGRVIESTNLNEINTIDSVIPLKLSVTPSAYFQYGFLSLFTLIILVFILQIILFKIEKSNILT